jgi:hypothetical protein
MRRQGLEIRLALATIVLLAAVYIGVVSRLESPSAAGGLLGHGLGIAGFLLMLMTETLYSLRKRSRQARWGRLATWLQFHIFTGLVGPFMVLLHTSWKFNGLAGVVLLLTVTIVLSGILGRYIYTAVPRTADGVVREVAELEGEIDEMEQVLRDWLETKPQAAAALAPWLDRPERRESGGLRWIAGRIMGDWVIRWRWWWFGRQLDPSIRRPAEEMGRLLTRRHHLQRQLASLATARRMLSLWHSVHIPIGVVLFTTAFVHIGAALYFATLLK